AGRSAHRNRSLRNRSPGNCSWLYCFAGIIRGSRKIRPTEGSRGLRPRAAESGRGQRTIICAGGEDPAENQKSYDSFHKSLLYFQSANQAVKPLPCESGGQRGMDPISASAAEHILALAPYQRVLAMIGPRAVPGAA